MLNSKFLLSWGIPASMEGLHATISRPRAWTTLHSRPYERHHIPFYLLESMLIVAYFSRVQSIGVPLKIGHHALNDFYAWIKMSTGYLTSPRCQVNSARWWSIQYQKSTFVSQY